MELVRPARRAQSRARPPSHSSPSSSGAPPPPPPALAVAQHSLSSPDARLPEVGAQHTLHASLSHASRHPPPAASPLPLDLVPSPAPRRSSPLRPAGRAQPALRPPQRRDPPGLPLRRVRRHAARVRAGPRAAGQGAAVAAGDHERREGPGQRQHGRVRDGQGWVRQWVGHEGLVARGVQAPGCVRPWALSRTVCVLVLSFADARRDNTIRQA